MVFCFLSYIAILLTYVHVLLVHLHIHELFANCLPTINCLSLVCIHLVVHNAVIHLDTLVHAC